MDPIINGKAAARTDYYSSGASFTVNIVSIGPILTETKGVEQAVLRFFALGAGFQSSEFFRSFSLKNA